VNILKNLYCFYYL